jgi:hypothetical protein
MIRSMRGSIAVLLAAAAAVVAVTSATAGPAKPKLVVAQRAPLVIAGSGFAAGERVSVTLLTGYGAKHASTVARGGRFRVEFRVTNKGCGAPWAARAKGSGGSTAFLAFAGAQPCVPPPMS